LVSAINKIVKRRFIVKRATNLNLLKARDIRAAIINRMEKDERNMVKFTVDK
jgi:hypothetical protein